LDRGTALFSTKSEGSTGAVIEARELPTAVTNSLIPNGSTVQEIASDAVSEGGYVASKNGTKYHLPWCGSAKQIKEENKIWFKTKADAEAAGYTPASNCKGI
jgi:hypothetical protein